MTSHQQHITAIDKNLSKHFIFNTLNSINSFIVENNAVIASDYLSKFGKLLRLVIENSTQQTITLAKEIEALELYMILEKMRFQNNVDLQIDIDKHIDVQNTMVPSLILQPYIECAVWNSLVAGVKNKVILEIQLVAQNKIMYTITEVISKVKPKLSETPLPHESMQQIENAKKWISQNASLFAVEKINLYNEAHLPIAQKTIIQIPIY